MEAHATHQQQTTLRQLDTVADLLRLLAILDEPCTHLTLDGLVDLADYLPHRAGRPCLLREADDAQSIEVVAIGEDLEALDNELARPDAVCCCRR